MERKAVSGIMLTLLFIGMSTSAFNIRSAKAQSWHYNFKIKVTPESPTTLDEIKVMVSFDLPSISEEVTFSSVSQIGNEFLVGIDIYVPQKSSNNSYSKWQNREHSVQTIENKKEKEDQKPRLIEFTFGSISSFVVPHACRRNVVSAQPLPLFSATFCPIRRSSFLFMRLMRRV